MTKEKFVSVVRQNLRVYCDFYIIEFDIQNVTGDGLRAAHSYLRVNAQGIK